MKRIIFLIIIFVLCAASKGEVKPEFRGLWVQAWKPGLLSQSEVESTVKWAKECNFNAIIAQIRKTGDAYYDSAYEPRADNIRGPEDFDPLQCVIENAHANGMEVHAWVNIYRVLTPTVNPSPDHVTFLHPEWLSEDYDGDTCSPDGTYLDPGLPEVREYIAMIVSDILSKYDVDGINLDYIRYPGKEWGYNPKAVAIFNREYGRYGIPTPDDPEWCDWRREQVTKTVREVYNTIASQRPDVTLSAATITWGKCPWEFEKTAAYAKVFQDWRSWMEDGILDANMPMAYKNPSDAQQSIDYAGWLIGAKRWAYGRHVYPGIMVYGSNVTGASTQIRSAQRREMPGVVGFSFSQIDCKKTLASKLRSMVFQSAVPVPEMPWKDIGEPSEEETCSIP